MEGCAKALQEANSFSLWLMSGLLSQLKRDGFKPSDPSLFDSAISSISCCLSNRTQTAAALSDFLVLKRRESYLGHASVPLSTVQKRELLVTPGSSTVLPAQDLIEKLSGQVKEDSFISSSLSFPNLPTPNRWGGVSPLRPPKLRAPLVGLVHPVIHSRWTTRIPALSLHLGSVPPLPAEVAAVSGLGVAGVWLLLRNPNRSFWK